MTLPTDIKEGQIGHRKTWHKALHQRENEILAAIDAAEDGDLLQIDKANGELTRLPGGTYAKAGGLHVGYFDVTKNETKSIIGLGFKPKNIHFNGQVIGGTIGAGVDRGDGSGGSVNNYAGGSHGFAGDNNGTVVQAVLHSGGSGNSINSTSHYASSSYCYAIRYADQDGGKLGLMTISLDSFDSDGFTITISGYQQDESVIFAASAD